MNNLTQKQDAEKAYLEQQQERMLEHYKTVSLEEREAVLRHIDSFLPVVPIEGRAFWIEFRSKLESLDRQHDIINAEVLQ